MRNSKEFCAKQRFGAGILNIGYENQQSMAEKAPQIGYVGTFRIRLSRSMEKTIFYIGFLNCFCGILHDTIKIGKIAHDLSEHGIPYPALLFGPTNRAVFYRQKMLPEPAEQTLSRLPPERQQRRYNGQGRRRHGNIGNDFLGNEENPICKNNSTAVPGRRPIHSVRCGWALLPLLYERGRQRFSYLHFRRSAALGALRHRSGQRNLPLGRGMLLGTGML